MGGRRDRRSARRPGRGRGRPAPSPARDTTSRPPGSRPARPGPTCPTAAMRRPRPRSGPDRPGVPHRPPARRGRGTAPTRRRRHLGPVAEAGEDEPHAMRRGRARGARRRTASSRASPGAGWPHTEFVQTPGKVALPRARRVREVPVVRRRRPRRRGGAGCPSRGRWPWVRCRWPDRRRGRAPPPPRAVGRVAGGSVRVDSPPSPARGRHRRRPVAGPRRQGRSPAAPRPGGWPAPGPGSAGCSASWLGARTARRTGSSAATAATAARAWARPSEMPSPVSAST